MDGAYVRMDTPEAAEAIATLRTEHMQRITDPHAVRLYDSLCAACLDRPDGLSETAQHIIGDIAMMEQLKQRTYDDVAKHGAIVKVVNGRQTYYQENKGIQQARMLMEQQRKHLNELRLTPSSRKAIGESLGDEFSNF